MLETLLIRLVETYKAREVAIREDLEAKVNEIFERMYHGHRRVTIDAKYHVELLTTMLLDKTTEMSSEERINRAFRYDTQPEMIEQFRQNMELFHDYVRGGIEVMFERFTDGCQTQDDYLNKTYEIMTTFKSELEGVSYEEELARLLR